MEFNTVTISNSQYCTMIWSPKIFLYHRWAPWKSPILDLLCNFKESNVWLMAIPLSLWLTTMHHLKDCAIMTMERHLICGQSDAFFSCYAYSNCLLMVSKILWQWAMTESLWIKSTHSSRKLSKIVSSISPNTELMLINSVKDWTMLKTLSPNDLLLTITLQLNDAELQTILYFSKEKKKGMTWFNFHIFWFHIWVKIK